ncbi:UNVERIFIED_CONTAM: hypothetical protein GTU68_049026 [Idotea baltica]|nr:hypothetical protein [Idotea baltica]
MKWSRPVTKSVSRSARTDNVFARAKVIRWPKLI